MPKPAPATVTIYPTGTHYIPGVPATVTECDPMTAEVLLAYRPAAFTTEPPPDPAPTDQAAIQPEAPASSITEE